ncbi:hypothetical protein LZ31DRAFT_133198 [Colletotrichum somersetense]|nr:hypothetical protein LZ31DRAFT_133198 [Colletotrichum somersetense]
MSNKARVYVTAHICFARRYVTIPPHPETCEGGHIVCHPDACLSLFHLLMCLPTIPLGRAKWAPSRPAESRSLFFFHFFLFVLKGLFSGHLAFLFRYLKQPDKLASHSYSNVCYMVVRSVDEAARLLLGHAVPSEPDKLWLLSMFCASPRGPSLWF